LRYVNRSYLKNAPISDKADALDSDYCVSLRAGKHKFLIKGSCGSASDGVLNFMTFSVVSAQIIINVVNAANNNNNNNNDNNNNNNNNDQNENDNTFMITVTNSNSRRSHQSNFYSILHDLVGNPYGARYPSWFKEGFKILNQNSTFYDSFTRNTRHCLLKSICLMAKNRQISGKSLEQLIYKYASLYVTAQLSNHLDFQSEETLDAVSSSLNCERSYPLCKLE